MRRPAVGWAAVTVATLLLIGCTARQGDRTLPRDRGAALLYVALGDSTVEGVGASSPGKNYVSRLYERLRERYPAARFVNLGVGGATSADVVNGQIRRAATLRPDLITLSIGPNDITTRVPVGQYERNVESILTALASQTEAVVIVNLIPDLAVTPRFRDSELREVVGRQTVLFNDVLRRLAREHRAELVDLYTPSQQEVPDRPELISEDRYHPSDVGYARWAELMWDGVDHRIPRR